MTQRGRTKGPERDNPARTRGASVAGWVGMVVHGLLGVFPYGFSGLLAPPWAVVTVAVVWFGLLVAAVYLRKRRPLLVAATPIASLTFWFVFLTFGDLLLGWTA